MNMKFIASAAALAVSMGSASTIANSSALGFCGRNDVYCSQVRVHHHVVSGNVKPDSGQPPVALGKVKLLPAVNGQPTSTRQPCVVYWGYQGRTVNCNGVVFTD